MLGEQRGAGMDADAHAHGSRGKRSLDLGSRLQRSKRGGEGEKRSIAFAVDDLPAVRGGPILDHRSLRAEHLGPCGLAVRAQKPCRSLDVREEERHRARRQLRATHVAISSTTFPRLPRAATRSKAACACARGKTESTAGRITPASARRASSRSWARSGSTTK